MLKRTDIDEKQMEIFRAVADFDCTHLSCFDCPFNTSDIGCLCLEMRDMLERYEQGEEMIY